MTLNGRRRPCRTVRFDPRTNSVLLVEQRLLPHEFRIVAAADFRATAKAIQTMVVRGAGAIGATAAYGLAQGARAFRGGDLEKFERHVEVVFQLLKNARPTAVDPVNAMVQVRSRMAEGGTVIERQRLALEAAEEFAQDDIEQCEAIGRHGVKLIRNGMKVLTHCNAGWLAFVDVGSATAPLYAAHARGRRFHVYCDETRPRFQGATLTAWELAQQGISNRKSCGNNGSCWKLRMTNDKEKDLCCPFDRRHSSFRIRVPAMFGQGHQRAQSEQGEPAGHGHQAGWRHSHEIIERVRRRSLKGQGCAGRHYTCPPLPGNHPEQIVN